MRRKEDCEGERRHGVAEKRVAKAKRDTRRGKTRAAKAKKETRRGKMRAAKGKLRAGDGAR